jgi:hypothetical protein
MARRMSEGHAKLRLQQRTGVDGFGKLRRAVSEGRFAYLRRQTCTRSLCRAMVDDEEVYFVLNRNRGTIITVLSEEQALSWIRDNGQGQASGTDQGDQASQSD